MLELTFMTIATCWGCCQRSKDATRLHCQDVIFWLQEIQKKNPNPPKQKQNTKSTNQPTKKSHTKRKKGWLSQVIISHLSDRISFFQMIQDQPNGMKMEDSKCKFSSSWVPRTLKELRLSWWKPLLNENTEWIQLCSSLGWEIPYIQTQNYWKKIFPQKINIAIYQSKHTMHKILKIYVYKGCFRIW